MRSSISSSESLRRAGRRADGPLRAIPGGPWRVTIAVAAVVFLLAMGAWETFWRSQGFRPSYRNSDGLWALTHRRLDREGPAGTAVIGSSRVLFDVNLEAWRDVTGTLPVQLALEGTNPRPVLDHLANETDFAGFLLVGVTPSLFFTPGFGFRADALARYRSETWSERSGQRISMAIEPYLAFYDFDTALFTVIRRQTWWPEREGVSVMPEVRKLSDMRRTRQADMWWKVERDPAYRQLCRDIWLRFIHAPREMPPPEAAAKMLESIFDEVAADVRTIRGRGGEVAFVRAPSAGPFREAEAGGFPRERFWDELLRRTDAVGIHFEDHADLRDVEVPEWSHVRAGDTDRFTRALIGHLREALAARGTPRKELEP